MSLKELIFDHCVQSNRSIPEDLGFRIAHSFKIPEGFRILNIQSNFDQAFIPYHTLGSSIPVGWHDAPVKTISYTLTLLMIKSKIDDWNMLIKSIEDMPYFISFSIKYESDDYTLLADVNVEDVDECTCPECIVMKMLEGT